MTRVLVCGGRGYKARETVFDFLDKFHADEPITLLVHGACCYRNQRRGTVDLCGADRWAEEWAITRQIPYVGVPAEWNKFGRPAGPNRNASMLVNWRPDWVIAFPGGTGTAGMVEMAKKARFKVREFEKEKEARSVETAPSP